MCDSPLTAYRDEFGAVVFNEDKAAGASFPIPCGRCMGCRIRRRQDWTLRGLLEAQMQRRDGFETFFFTLTQDEDHAEQWSDLSLRDVQLFVKRLRFRFGPGVRFQSLGEYGGGAGRAHYHQTVFGLQIPDLVPLSKRAARGQWFESAVITELWGRGHVAIALATEQTIAYVASHQTKDLSGTYSESGAFFVVDPLTGEARKRRAPFRTQSNRPGIGARFFEEFGEDLWRNPKGFPVDGSLRPIPSYFLSKLKERDPEAWRQVVLLREDAMASDAFLAEQTSERKAVRAVVRASRFKSLRPAGADYAPGSRVLHVPGLSFHPEGFDHG